MERTYAPRRATPQSSALPVAPARRIPAAPNPAPASARHSFARIAIQRLVTQRGENEFHSSVTGKVYTTRKDAEDAEAAVRPPQPVGEPLSQDEARAAPLPPPLPSSVQPVFDVPNINAVPQDNPGPSSVLAASLDAALPPPQPVGEPLSQDEARAAPLPLPLPSSVQPVSDVPNNALPQDNPGRSSVQAASEVERQVDIERGSVNAPPVNERSRLIPQAQPGLWERFRNWRRRMRPSPDEHAAFALANTPGPLTGAVGLTQAGLALGSAPRSITDLRGDVVNSRGHFGWGPTSTVGSTAMQGTSGIANVLTGLADIQGARKGWSETTWAGLRSWKDKLLGRNPPGPGAAPVPTGYTNIAQHEEASKSKRGALDVAATTTDLLANQAPNAVSQGMNVASHFTTLSSGAQAALPVLGAVSGVASGVISGGVMARSAYRAHQAGKHVTNVQAAYAAIENNPNVSDEVKEAARHQIDQMKTRRRRNIAGAVGAGLGVAGSALAVAGLAGVAGAALLTPIGWALLAAGGLVAGGIGAWKLGRWLYKKHTNQLGTARDTNATELHRAVTSNDARDHQSRAAAEMVLTARGIDPEQIRQADPADAIKHLKRKAESW